MNIDGFIITNQKPKVPRIGIGLIGYRFMGKVHTDAYKRIGYKSDTWPPPAIPDLIAICGRNKNNVKKVP